MAQSDFFGKPDNPKLAKAISLKNPSEAQRSVQKLEKMWRNAKSETERLEILRAANLAANRAGAQLQRGDLSPSERRQFNEIQKIYRSFINKHEGKTGKTMGKGPRIDTVGRMKNRISAPKVELGFNTDLSVKKKYDKFF